MEDVTTPTLQAEPTAEVIDTAEARRKRIAEYLGAYEMADILAVLEAAWTFDGRRGVSAVLLGAAREVHEAMDASKAFPVENPVILAAWNHVCAMDNAARVARLQEVGAA